MGNTQNNRRQPKVGTSAVVCDERLKRPRHRPLVNSLTAYMCHKYEGWLDRGQTESEKLAASTPVEEGKIIAFPSSHTDKDQRTAREKP